MFHDTSRLPPCPSPPAAPLTQPSIDTPVQPPLVVERRVSARRAAESKESEAIATAPVEVVPPPSIARTIQPIANVEPTATQVPVTGDVETTKPNNSVSTRRMSTRHASAAVSTEPINEADVGQEAGVAEPATRGVKRGRGMVDYEEEAARKEAKRQQKEQDRQEAKDSIDRRPLTVSGWLGKRGG